MTEPADGRRPRGGRIVLAFVSVAALGILCCGGATASFFLGGLGNDGQQYSMNCGQAALVDPNTALPRAGSLTDEQMRNAAIIVQVGQQLKVAPRGWVIAIATAMQESWLRNLGDLGARNDHDSLGLFQQRPSQGWGTPEQVMDPVYASRKFYEHLLAVKGWESMSLTVAAQRVQKSAFPDAYAKHEPLATLTVNVLTNGGGLAAGALSDVRCALMGEIAASGWIAPVKGGVVSGFRTPSRPSHYGVDLAAAKRTVIVAASAGTVIKVRCNALGPNGSAWGCDRDGTSNVRGCGWYVDIMHAGAIMTRYCHMVVQPMVTVGQQVAAGQQIGLSGSSGRSSGPHLHFEVHVNGDSSNAGAIDPVAFMRDKGAALGVQA